MKPRVKSKPNSNSKSGSSGQSVKRQLKADQNVQKPKTETNVKQHKTETTVQKPKTETDEKKERLKSVLTYIRFVVEIGIAIWDHLSGGGGTASGGGSSA